ncbi:MULTISPECIES: hypothetical protein [unclassified Arcicella]|uniref:hypothetical protein n=1 Tax=unclassified Arcicella TaxID=2644986 RepID=UPI0028632AF4|nr:MULTISPECIES: hypothetical protein [unclassified Arcicella]MDR6564607.1 hypothetical protein [Arcicella sp. BE51]MDR6814465.1 hypothetical protein [Arcicella sp. BE140]MDR6825779.1 hypothetical protein [Arcicella sp. BE139]
MHNSLNIKKIPFISIILFILLSIVNVFGQSTILTVAKNYKKEDLYILNDHNEILLKKIGLKIQLKEINDTDYHVNISDSTKKVILKGKAQGISKIFSRDKYTCFVLYDFYSEDGNSIGRIFTIDNTSHKISISKQSFKNACNPVVVNDSIFIFDDFNLKILNLNYKVASKIPLKIYSKNSDKTFDYLDTCVICDLDIIGEMLNINFSPNKLKVECKNYAGKFYKSGGSINIKIN